MKKIINFLVISILLLPLLVFADGGGPIFVQYDAYVSDKNGAYLYTYAKSSDSCKGDCAKLEKTSILLNYNTQVKVIYEEEVSKNEYYALIEYIDEENDNVDESEYEEDDEHYYQSTYYINLKKLSLLKEELTYEDLKKEYFTSDEMSQKSFADIEEGYTDDGKIYAVKDIQLYKGPSFKYDKKDTIVKAGDILKAKANIDDWIYVETDNYYGWIKQEENTAYETSKHWFLEDTPLYDSYKLTNKVEEFIPKDTIIDKEIYSYYYSNESGEYINTLIVQYNDKYLWVNKKDIIYAEESYEDYDCYVVKDIPTYSSFIDKNSNGKIEKGTIIKRTFTGYEEKNSKIVNSGNYVETKNTWVKDEERNLACSDGYDTFCSANETFISIKEIPLLDDIGGNEIATLPANTIIKGCYEYNVEASNDEDFDETYVYIKYNNKNYWFKLDENAANENEEKYSTENLEKDAYIYDKAYGTATDVSIPAGTSLWFKYDYYDYNNKETWYYVTSKKYTGWILSKEDENTGVKESIERYEKLKNNNETINTPIVNVEPEEVVVNNKLSKKEMIIICSLSAVILALVIAVVIILINKKKKENQTTESVNESNAENTSEATQVVEINKDDKTIQQETTMGGKE